MAELKPCPFCGTRNTLGGKPITVQTSSFGGSLRYVFVRCTTCNSQGTSFLWNMNSDISKYEQLAIEAWNRRAYNG